MQTISSDKLTHTLCILILFILDLVFDIVFQNTTLVCSMFCVEPVFDTLTVTDREKVLSAVSFSGCDVINRTFSSRSFTITFSSDGSVTNAGFQCVLQSGKTSLQILFSPSSLYCPLIMTD